MSKHENNRRDTFNASKAGRIRRDIRRAAAARKAGFLIDGLKYRAR